MLEKAQRYLSSTTSVQRKATSVQGKAKANKISKEDYFRYNVQFSAWLGETYGKAFDELTTKEARKLFVSTFIPEWNSGKYRAKSSQLDSRRTSFAWSLKKPGRDYRNERVQRAVAQEREEGRYLTGFEARQMKRKHIGERTHGEPSAERMNTFSDRFLYEDTSLDRPAQHKTARVSAKRKRLNDRLLMLQEKERQKMNDFKKQMGLS